MWHAPPYSKESRTDRLFSLNLIPMLAIQFKRYWTYYLFAGLCLGATHLISVKIPFLAKELSEIVENPDASVSIMTFILLAVGILLFRTFSRLAFFYPARVLERDMKVAMVEMFESTPPFRYEDKTQGNIYQILANDIEQIRALIGFALLQVGNVAIALAILIPKLQGFNSELLLALLPLVISFFLFTLIVGSTRHYHRKTMDLQAEVQNQVIEVYNGRQTIKNYQKENVFLSLFGQTSLKELVSHYKAGIGISFSIPLIPLGIGLSLVWGSYIIFKNNLGTGSLVLFSGFVYLFMEPLSFLSWIGVVFASAGASWKRIRECYDLLLTPSKEEVFQRDNETHLNEKQNIIVVNYFGEKEKIEFFPGKWQILVGKTGSGKSTLLFQLGYWFKSHGYTVSLVAQTPYIYNDSVLNNIFLGKVPTEDERKIAFELLRLVGLDVLSFDRDILLNLEVGENGKHLSGGQAKRLCLVRSLLSSSNVVLWDDPFSSIDLTMEREIVDKIKELKLLTGKIVIFTGHRLSTVRTCEKIVLMKSAEKKLMHFDCNVLEDPKSEVYEHFEKQMGHSILAPI